VAPGTSAKTNANALNMLAQDSIFTNVAITAKNEPWWEGKSDEIPVIDWQGKPYDPADRMAAHPNSRFTVSSKQCPSYSSAAENPQGVPISAIIFGGRRAELAPLVFEANNWKHGVLVGASVASETTAAATGAVGQVRRDPMAMKPFCGYNFADYWAHWLSFADKSEHLPKIFHVNWFRQDAGGRFIWPGFGENLRVLKWILERCEGKAHAVTTPIGKLPASHDIDTRGLNISRDDLAALLAVSPQLWVREMENIGSYLETFGNRLPKALRDQHHHIVSALENELSADAAD
jgi:phosphoenolpyruvate carboxykinase (GTP)